MTKKPKTGFAIHLHHDILAEYCYDYGEWVEEIKHGKPEHERADRLRLFKILPDRAINDLPKYYVEAYREWMEAYREREEAHREWMEADRKWEEAYRKRMEAYREWMEAYREREEAYREREEAYREWMEAYRKWVEAQDRLPQSTKNKFHAKWCGCKLWDGEELVFHEKKEKKQEAKQ